MWEVRGEVKRRGGRVGVLKMTILVCVSSRRSSDMKLTQLADACL